MADSPLERAKCDQSRPFIGLGPQGSERTPYPAESLPTNLAGSANAVPESRAEPVHPSADGPQNGVSTRQQNREEPHAR